MAVTRESQNFLRGSINLANVDAPVARQGMKTTNIPGYSMFATWGRWGSCEVNASGTNKAFLFLPYLQAGPIPLVRVTGRTSMETPLDIVASEGIVNPYNCKVSVTPSLNVSGLKEGDYYSFLLALKPACVGGSNPVAYWDGWLKAFGASSNDVAKDLFNLFLQTQNLWDKMKASNGLVQSLPFPPPPPPSDESNSDNSPK
jgi:hypothetical protein